MGPAQREGEVVVRETDVPLRILRLEQKLESYQKLHTEELDEIRLALAVLTNWVLDMTRLQQRAVRQTRTSRHSSDRSS